MHIKIELFIKLLVNYINMQCDDIGSLIELLKHDESINEHIVKHKYFLWEKSGKEVSWEQAWCSFVESDFFQKDLFPKLQEKYCGQRCTRRYACHSAVNFLPESDMPGYYLG